MIINLLQDFSTFQVNVLTNVAKQRSWWGWGHSVRLNRADTNLVWSQCPLSLTKNLPHSEFYHHQMAISLLSLSRQEKRWLLRRSAENQDTIKTEHAETPSHLHNTTGRFNFQGMQNVIDLIDSDNKTSTTADSHVLGITSTAPGPQSDRVERLGQHYDVTDVATCVSLQSRITFLHRHQTGQPSSEVSVRPYSCHHRSGSLRWSEQSINKMKTTTEQTNKEETLA